MCPRCQVLEDRIFELEQALGLPPITPIEVGKGNTRIWRLFCLLAKRGTLRREAASIVIFDNPTFADRNDNKALDVYMHHLRKFLRPHGIIIATRYGEGWYIPPLMQKQATALIKQLSEIGQ